MSGTLNLYANLLYTTLTSGASSTRVRLLWGSSVSCTFSIVAKVTSGTATVILTDGTNTLASISVTETSYTRKTASFTATNNTDVWVSVSGGTGASVIKGTASRSGVSNSGSSTELTYIDLGNLETGKTNTTAAALTQPKYWTYNSGDYASSGAFAFDIYVSGVVSDTMGTATFVLQEDDGAFGSWTNLVTIGTIATTSQTFINNSFTPTSGRHYRLAASISSNMYNYSVYWCAIGVYPTSGVPTKREIHQLILNTGDAGTGLQNKLISYTSSDWSVGGSGSLTIKHSIDSDNASNSAKLVDVSTSTDVTSSTVTGANQQTSSGLTITSGDQFDTNVTNSTGSVNASRLIYYFSYAATNTTASTGLGQVTATGYAPTVTATNNTTVSTGLGQATVTGFSPTVTASDNKIISTGLGSVISTGYAPVLNYSINTGIGALTVTGYEPTITLSIVAQTDVGSAVVTGYSPTVTATNNITVSVGLGQVIADGYAPQAGAPVTINTFSGDLTITGFAPTVSADASVTVNTGLGVLTAIGYVPTVSATNNIIVNCGVGYCQMDGHISSINITNNQTVSTLLGELNITGYEPTVINPVSVEIGLGELVTDGYEPNIRVNTRRRFIIIS